MTSSMRTLAAIFVALVCDSIAPAQVKDFKPVTDAMLQNPDPADWINWRRTYNTWGYSPLRQINKQNVHQLQLAWAWAMGAGDSEPTPLVYNGVMYLPNPRGVVQALDAATGELLWEYKKDLDAPPKFLSVMRNLAIYDDKIYLNTSDAHIVALNARTGKVVWDQKVADYKLGYRYTSGPIVVKGKVIAGMTGCDRFKVAGVTDVCFISAYDAQSGKELWRTSTVARPGEPGGETWGDLPLIYRAGSDAWIPGSYDPQTDLIYWGTSQAKPWARLQRGNAGDALYSNSALALNPETGKIVWHHQYVPGESHDLDEGFESILVDHDGRTSLFEMGKFGILWELDRKTGKFLSAHDLGYQNLIDVDSKTGAVTYRPGMIPKADVPVDYCPSAGGIKTWRAMAYHPETQAFYIPTNYGCAKTSFLPVDFVEGGGNNSLPPYAGTQNLGGHPDPKHADNPGEFLAMDIKTGKLLWRHQTATNTSSAALTTAGGLAIVGDWDRNLYIHDVATGDILFHTRLGTSATGFPITYAVSGKQYLAIPVGTIQFPPYASGTTPPPTQPGPGGRRRPTGGNAIYVFALPDAQPTGAR